MVVRIKSEVPYVPFWLFDASAEADCRFHATRSHTHHERNYRVTVIEHF